MDRYQLASTVLWLMGFSLKRDRRPGRAHTSLCQSHTSSLPTTPAVRVNMATLNATTSKPSAIFPADAASRAPTNWRAVVWASVRGMSLSDTYTRRYLHSEDVGAG